MPPRRGRQPRRNMEEQSEESVGHQPPPPPPPPPPPQPKQYIEIFLNQKPPQFDGLGEPAKAETWIRALERIFDFMECTDKERLACVTFQLTGPADFWWETKRRTMNPARREALTWEEFKEEVYNKYIPMSYRRAKIVEFHTLTQGRMTVTEYDRALCETSRYAPEIVDTDEKMAEKFRAGLRHEIRAAVASRRGITYSELLSCALDVEEALPKEKVLVNTTITPPSPQQQHNSQDKRKWDGNRDPYDNKRQQLIKNPPQYGRRHQGGEYRTPPCARCSRFHFGECKAGRNECYSCGGNGHIARECPNKNTRMGARNNNKGQPTPLQAIEAEPRRDPPLPPHREQYRDNEKDA